MDMAEFVRDLAISETMITRRIMPGEFRDGAVIG